MRVAAIDLGTNTTRLLVADVENGCVDEVVRHTKITELGSVRLTERFLPTDPPTGEELEACAAAVRAALPSGHAERAIGVAGTVTSLAAIDLGLDEYDRHRVHGHVITTEAARELTSRLAAMPLAERRRVPELDPDRAPVIVAGAIILR